MHCIHHPEPASQPLPETSHGLCRARRSRTGSRFRLLARAPHPGGMRLFRVAVLVQDLEEPVQDSCNVCRVDRRLVDMPQVWCEYKVGLVGSKVDMSSV